MKPIKLFRLLILLFLICNLSCQLDDGFTNNDSQNTFSQYFGNEISRDFLGTVIDKNHSPIQGVTVTIGDDSAITDSNGIFIINNATINQRFGYIKAERAGYIHASRSVVPTNGTNKITIMMLEATVTGSVTSGSSATITTNNGSSVSFDGNFIKEDGSAYSGSVDVIMHHLDPADDDMSLQMPGMLYAQNTQGEERMLQTLGMLAVELRGSGGEDLNLAEGSTSEIKIPVDPSLMNIAPTTIPLWYFDEVNGYWKEEGEATLQGNMYVGTVSHFSFWNCDIPAEAITLCITSKNEDGVDLNNLNVKITSSVYGTRWGQTNEKGEVCGLVPRNENLELSVFGNDCDNSPLYTEIIGPFNSDSSITIIVPDSPYIILETITGILNTCDGDSVTNGYVEINYGNLTFYEYLSNGSFEIILNRCSNNDNNTFSIIGSDFSNYQTTESTNYTFTTPLTDIGTLNACLSQEEYIQYVIDNSIFVSYTDFIDVILGDDRLVILKSTNGAFLADLPNQIGTYTVDSENSNVFNFNVPGSGYIFMGQEGIVINVTYVGTGIGDFIDMNFSGTFINQGTTRTIDGFAHVRIDL